MGRHVRFVITAPLEGALLGRKRRRHRVTSRSDEQQPGRDASAPTYPDLAGKVAVITGSSRGIGATTCRLLAFNGVSVVVNGRDEDAVSATVDRIPEAGGEATGIALDATKPEDLERLHTETERTDGPVDVLGAFVGGGGPLPGPTAEITPEEWRAAIDGNLTVTFLALRTFLPGMTERGHGSTGYATGEGRCRATKAGGGKGGGPARRQGQLRRTFHEPDRTSRESDARGAKKADDGNTPARPSRHARGRRPCRPLPRLGECPRASPASRLMSRAARSWSEQPQPPRQPERSVVIARTSLGWHRRTHSQDPERRSR